MPIATNTVHVDDDWVLIHGIQKTQVLVEHCCHSVVYAGSFFLMATNVAVEVNFPIVYIQPVRVDVRNQIHTYTHFFLPTE